MSKRGSESLKKYTGVSWSPSKIMVKRLKGKLTKSQKKKIKLKNSIRGKQKIFDEICESFCFSVSRQTAVKFRKIERIFLDLRIKQIFYVKKEAKMYLKSCKENNRYSDLFDFFSKIKYFNKNS